MSCEGCFQEIKNANAEERKIYKQAADKAKETGEWQAIYKDEFGKTQFIAASAAAGFPVRLYITPQYKDTSL